MLRLLQIAWVFGTASIMSFGGGTAIVPQLQLQTVVTHQWLTPSAFADDFAIAQVAPGPSVLLVTLLGNDAGGIPGALVATVAMILPAALIVAVVAHYWMRGGKSRWHVAMEKGVAPIGVGLVAASGLVVASSVDSGALQWMLSIAAAVMLAVTRINPLFVLAGAGFISFVAG